MSSLINPAIRIFPVFLPFYHTFLPDIFGYLKFVHNICHCTACSFASNFIGNIDVINITASYDTVLLAHVTLSAIICKVSLLISTVLFAL